MRLAPVPSSAGNWAFPWPTRKFAAGAQEKTRSWARTPMKLWLDGSTVTSQWWQSAGLNWVSLLIQHLAEKALPEVTGAAECAGRPIPEDHSNANNPRLASKAPLPPFGRSAVAHAC